uniref:Uncharacterized protein n=1 Tax=Oryza punctata TaxID=4537 RepID=A0A0E0KF51_ORYPU
MGSMDGVRWGEERRRDADDFEGNALMEVEVVAVLMESSSFHRGRRWSNRPGRASSSTSWIEDKARANAARNHLGGGERRIASSSESWVQDQDKPSSSIAGAGERKVADGDELPFAGAGEKKRSPPSPDDRLEKRARFHHRGDGKNLEEMFAGRWMVRDGVREATGC